jgi:hypothetical protein
VEAVEPASAAATLNANRTAAGAAHLAVDPLHACAAVARRGSIEVGEDLDALVFAMVPVVVSIQDGEVRDRSGR